MFAIAILMLLIMQNSEQDKNTKSKII